METMIQGVKEVQLSFFEQLYVVGSENLHTRLILQLFNRHFSELGCHIIPEINLEECNHDRCLVLINCHDFEEYELIEELNKLYQHRNDLPVMLMNVDQSNPLLNASEMPNVRGIFQSHCNQDTLISGIASIDQGNLWMPRVYADHLLKKLRLSPVGSDKNIQLSKREQQIINLVSKGHTNDEVANTLFLSPHTIKTHLYRIYKKIGAKNRFQAMEWARQQLPQH